MLKRAARLLIACCVGLLLAALTAELCLRVYNPFAFRTRGADIVLPVNARYIIDNTATDKLDRQVRHSKNSLGFRGPEPGSAAPGSLMVLTIGGSTTECFYVSDGKTWPDLLAQALGREFGDRVLLDNAGLDGQSTRGHLILLEKLPRLMHADVILFLVGINDVSVEENAVYDLSLERGGAAAGQQSLKARIRRAAMQSELVDTLVNLWRSWQARKSGLNHTVLDFRAMPQLRPGATPKSTPPDESRLARYAARLERMAALCAAQGTTAVFMTQPALYGPAVDEDTGVDLGNIDVSGGVSGNAAWARLEAFNAVTREVAARTGTPLIDLAARLPKRSAYFYDFIHYSNAGNRAVADAVYPAFAAVIRTRLERAR
jgi:lysophospholipase L1-like esterase